MSPAQINTRKSDIFKNFIGNKGCRFILFLEDCHFDYTDRRSPGWDPWQRLYDSPVPAREAERTGSRQGGFMQRCTPSVQIQPRSGNSVQTHALTWPAHGRPTRPTCSTWWWNWATTPHAFPRYQSHRSTVPRNGNRPHHHWLCQSDSFVPCMQVIHVISPHQWVKCYTKALSPRQLSKSSSLSAA